MNKFILESISKIKKPFKVLLNITGTLSTIIKPVDIKTRHYKGKVYGPEIVEHHVLFVRHKGKTCWVGNSNAGASKGVISKIIPNEEIVKNPATGQPYDVVFNPFTVISRMAPNQLVEASLAKIARKTGQVYKIPQDAPPEGWTAFAKAELAKHGLTDKEDVIDPTTGRTIKGINTGEMYFSAFHHLAEKKESARSTGAYDTNEQPVKGGADYAHAQRFGNLDVTAVLSHHAPEVIKDALLVKGAKNEDYWKALKYGRTIPEPTKPFIHSKFFNLLKAGGINIHREGDLLSLMPMTDKAITNLVGTREITDSGHVDNKFNTVKGGLFDEATTGGLAGNKWAYVKLHEPIPNPIMETPIQKLLGITAKTYRNILIGAEPFNGKTGGRAIQSALAAIDIDKAIEDNRKKLKTTRGAIRDRAIKSLGYLQAAKESGVHPSDWVITKAPVIPPIFRPITKAGNLTMVNDMNTLYTDLIESNNQVKDLSKELELEDLQEERGRVYDAMRAVMGLGQPINPEGRAKGLKGSIKILTGEQAKHGLIQSKLLSKPVDAVGRAVIVPDPDLDMDSVGIPDEKAWELYKPFVTRRLVRKGYTPERALKAIEDKTTLATEMLDLEMKHRPVFLDRAPTWHKFNFMAFNPRRVKGHVLHISPLITTGFNADHDGDTMAFHVPVSEKAVEQAKKKMFPSKNLFRTSTLTDVMSKPEKEFAMGLYEATYKESKKAPKIFKSLHDAKMAYRRGEVGLSDNIIIK